jgi:hypothetical protein
MQLDLFAPAPMPALAILPNDHGVYPDDEAETFTCPRQQAGWRGMPLCEIKLLHLDRGWLQSTNVMLADQGGGHGLSEKFGGGFHETRGSALSAALDAIARRTAVMPGWTTVAAHDAWRVREWMGGIS